MGSRILRSLRRFYGRIRAEAGMGGVGDFILALALVAPFLIMFSQWLEFSAEENAKLQAASHLEMVLDASERYTRDHYAALQAAATALNAEQITVPTLVAGGYLPPNFSALNIWGQAAVGYVLQPSPGSLQTLVVTTGGKGSLANKPDFANIVVPAAASRLGAKGGYIPTGLIAGQPSTTARGSGGAWQVLLAGTNIPNPGPGHLVAMSFLNEDVLGTDYLYRAAVPGHPELNRMDTDLDLSGHTLLMGGGDVGGAAGEGAGSVKFEAVNHLGLPCDNTADTKGRLVYDDAANGFFICEDGTWRRLLDETTGSATFQLVTSGDVVAKPTCEGATPTPQIFLSPATYAPGATGRYIKGVETFADDLGGSWRVQMQIMTDQGWYAPAGIYARMLCVTKCS